MADMRTRACPEGRSTSMESPSLTRVTFASSTGCGLGGSAATAGPTSSRPSRDLTTPPASLRRTDLWSLRGLGGCLCLLDLPYLMRTVYHIRADLFTVL